MHNTNLQNGQHYKRNTQNQERFKWSVMSTFSTDRLNNERERKSTVDGRLFQTLMILSLKTEERTPVQWFFLNIHMDYLL